MDTLWTSSWFISSIPKVPIYSLAIDYSMSEMFIMPAKSFSGSYGNPCIEEPAIQMQCVEMMLNP